MNMATTTPTAFNRRRLAQTYHVRYPEWALDPLTKGVMKSPVTINAPCLHCMEKSSFVVWTGQGNNVCPVCYTPMTQTSATPNKGLQKRIQYMLHEDDQTEEIAEDTKVSRTEAPVAARLSQNDHLGTEAATTDTNNCKPTSARPHLFGCTITSVQERPDDMVKCKTPMGVRTKSPPRHQRVIKTSEMAHYLSPRAGLLDALRNFVAPKTKEPRTPPILEKTLNGGTGKH